MLVRDHTSQEISGQPALWQETYQLLLSQQQSLRHFLRPLLARPDLTIILTGAGTSAFIGEVLTGVFQKNTGKITRAIATTDLVSHPTLFFPTESPTLLISFARSGNSPESVAAVELANTVCREVFHLVITCNPTGQLALQENGHRRYVITLPPAANDLSLAMTGSFSAMLLTGLLIPHLESLDRWQPQVDTLVAYGNHLLKHFPAPLQEVAALPFERVVFLGSGPLLGTARESHLKVQELTDGRVVGKYDSFLGFRHGPKVVADDRTLLVFLFSNDPYVQQYEVDLAQDFNQGKGVQYTIGVAEKKIPGVEVQLWIPLAEGNSRLDEALLAVCSVLPAQIIGYYKSLHLGFTPDEPSASGTISRVVQGVTIYPYSETP